MADANEQHAKATAEVAEAGSQAGKIRADAMAAAESLRANAATEAESQIAASHRQATMMKDRLEEQFAWRKEQLEREIAVLLQRKDSIIAQMANLRQMALDATNEYPNADPFAAVAAEAESAQDEDSDSNQQWLSQAPEQPVGQPNEPTTVIRTDQDASATAVIPEVTGDEDESAGANTTAIIPAESAEPTKVIKKG